MPFQLEEIVPWGRSFKEYVEMFSLSSEDLKSSILDCGGGPASFNAELSEKGGKVISIDPIYGFSANQIKSRIDSCFDEIVGEVERNKNNFVWDVFQSVKRLSIKRRKSMESFLLDYRVNQSNYVRGQLPILPFESETFDLALCSHLLFLYSNQLDLDFHLKSIEELCRVSKEVRIFPLLDLNANRSKHLDEVMKKFKKNGLLIKTQKVEYEFQKGAFEMLCINQKQ